MKRSDIENAMRPGMVVSRNQTIVTFGAELVFALNTPEQSASERAIRFAEAASCLAHLIEGDFNFSSRDEVEALMGSGGPGRVVP